MKAMNASKKARGSAWLARHSGVAVLVVVVAPVPVLLKAALVHRVQQVLRHQAQQRPIPQRTSQRLANLPPQVRRQSQRLKP